MSVRRIATLFCFFSSTCPAWGDEPLTAKNGLEYLKAAGQVVSTCDVFYRIDYAQKLKATLNKSAGKVELSRRPSGDGSKTQTKFRRMIADPARHRYEMYDKDASRLDAICVIVKTDWRYKEFSGQSGPSFTVRQRTIPPGGSWMDYREFLGRQFCDCSLYHLLSLRNSLKVSRDQDGKITMEADAEPGREISLCNNGYRVVLNPKRGMMVEELVEYFKGLPLRRSEVLDWHEFDKGTFAPVRMRTTSYVRANDELAGEVMGVYDLVVDVSRSSWNRPVDPSLFELHPDAGMPVVDSVKGIMTMGGKANPGENIDELVNQPIKFQTGPPPEIVKKSWPWTTITISSAALSLVVVGLWWRFRKAT